MASGRTKGAVITGVVATTLAVVVAFPLWVYVMGSILKRGGATDFEWFCFVAYCAVHIVISLSGSFVAAFFETVKQ